MDEEEQRTVNILRMTINTSDTSACALFYLQVAVHTVVVVVPFAPGPGAGLTPPFWMW